MAPDGVGTWMMKRFGNMEKRARRTVGQRELPEWANAAGPWLDLFGKVAPAVIAGAVLFVGQRLSDASDKVYARLEAIEKTLAMTCETLERNTKADEVADAQLVSLRTDMARVMARLGLD